MPYNEQMMQTGIAESKMLNNCERCPSGFDWLKVGYAGREHQLKIHNADHTGNAYIVQTDEHADEYGELVETELFEVRQLLPNGDAEAVDCCLTLEVATDRADAMNNPHRAADDAADAQRRADQIPTGYLGQLTAAQRNAYAQFAAVRVALGDYGLNIDAPENAHILDLLERWATAYHHANNN